MLEMDTFGPEAGRRSSEFIRHSNRVCKLHLKKVVNMGVLVANRGRAKR